MCQWCNCQGSPGIKGVSGSPVKNTGTKGGNAPTKIQPEEEKMVK
jgi:hypothetical protein